MQLNDHIISGNVAGLRKSSRNPQTDMFYLLQLTSIFQDSESVLANLAVQIKSRYVSVVHCGSVSIPRGFPLFLSEI